MDTIAAIATPHAPGGISVIRISGEQAISIAQKCFQSSVGKQLESMAGYTATYGNFSNGDGEHLDDGIATIFRAPHSYTGEDTVEFSCHGGIFVTEQILDAVYAAGAVPAQPGEFTKRAFLSGKLSLTQAEAVMEIIGATGKRQLAYAEARHEGALYRRIHAITEDLTHTLGSLAAWADYPEEEIPVVTDDSLTTDFAEILKKIDATLSTYHNGSIVESGIHCTIVGKPNVGKSTLFNLLAGKERSIVTAIPGTTRDIVEQCIRVGEYTLRLTDTAGIRETEDVVEQMGVELAQQQLEQADLILAVFDGAAPKSQEDIEILKALPTDKPCILILNKSDLELQESWQSDLPQGMPVIAVSAKMGSGAEALCQAMEELFHDETLTPEMGIVVNLRQKNCLEKARESVMLAQSALVAGECYDAITILLDDALEQLLELNGERITDAVVNDVFTRFCVGK